MRIVNIMPEDGFVQGNDLTWRVAIDNGATPPVAVNMTGWTLLYKLYRPDGTTALSKAATAVNLNAVADGFQWIVVDTDTISAAPNPAVVLAAGLYRHEGTRIDEGNEVTLFKGDVHLLASDRRQETS